jgi:hypothetical protein
MIRLKAAAGFGLWLLALAPAWGGVSYLDLSAAVNRGPQDSFDQSFPGAEDSQQKNGLARFPVGDQNFRGIPFRLLDPSKNKNLSFIALKGRERPDFPEAVTLKGPGGGVKNLYFLQTCHWGGTAADIRVAQYEVLYSDGEGVTIPLRVGREFTNFWGADDTGQSALAWVYRYKNSTMGVNLFAWKNPKPNQSIQSIVFRSLSKMPVPLLFAVTASDQDLPISPVSPKPESTLVTDMTGWIPFASPETIDGTAFDLSLWMDAPAGKHGAVSAKGTSLVFADGTPARFWGTRLSPDVLPLSPEDQEKLADLLAANGFNLVELPAGGEETFSPILPLLKEKGIYVYLAPASPVPAATAISSTPAPGIATPASPDPAFISSDFLSSSSGIFNPIVSQTPAPYTLDNHPQVTAPDQSLPGQLILSRSFGKPALAEWSEGWPQSYIAETPILLSAMAGFQGWAASVGQEVNGNASPAMVPGLDWTSNPLLYIQGPAAALAYLRGDLKQGKIYVLPDPQSDDPAAALQALAHQSGLGSLRTDPLGVVKAKIQAPLKSFVSDSGQIHWQGNIGLFQVDAPRFQAVAGFFSHRQVKGSAWEFESPNWFGSVSLISLTRQPITSSNHLLLTGVTRMENSGMVYNADQTKILSAGSSPLFMEPLKAQIVIYRLGKDRSLKIRALGADRRPLKTPVPFHWSGQNLAFSWVPEASYLEVYK